ncbi:efflux RND transporter periplasmic adaptor subunit [Ramlibacter sp.]|uniref:efflux RND transporter periplasmic adaptor subunit n=1 Tax=Ramlibacter sp. TaxID=1917967 RepID=UPI001849764D|nr:efflux RND transporter periplasmic adaptor subunit [Ramlibacter sp.]MBA2676144.1 efflux RND transporter periplasmic adaptor subunit [Ramlibacter sp.]
MKKQYLLHAAVAALAVALCAGGYGLYRLGMHQASRAGTAAAPAMPGAAAQAMAVPQGIPEGEDATRRHIAARLKAGDTDPATGRRILYYHDPMVPGKKFDAPGKSPFMNMMLVPAYADADADQGRVSVSPRMQQNLGIRTAPVAEGALAAELTATGSIAFNEREQAVIQARASGYVERLHVKATLDRVARGQVLAELYVPDWVAVQEEFLAVRRMQGAGLAALLDGARARMRQAGMSDAQIQRVERSGRPDPRIAVTAPIAGLVTEIGARDGMAVMPGATLFRINGFGLVWANADVPESQAALLRPGTRVVAQTPSIPGETFNGTVQAIVPDVSAATRTIKARVELGNPRGRLVPGMFVSMRFTDMHQDKSILVPTEAVIQTGRRTLVMLAEDNGRFRPVEVQAGAESGGQTAITRGLQPGQRVVVSSQFLIDSEASLRGLEARLNSEAPKAPTAAAAPRHQGEARIEAIGKDALTLSHGPIPSIRWGPMTMDFKLPAAGPLPRNLRQGDRVGFEFYMDTDGLPQLTRVSPLPAQAQGAGK